MSCSLILQSETCDGSRKAVKKVRMAQFHDRLAQRILLELKAFLSGSNHMEMLS